MTFDRRRFLQACSLAGAGLLVPSAAWAARPGNGGTGLPGSGVPDSAPQTGFEQRDGASWTTHEEELAFLTAVGASSRVRSEQIGQTLQGRPLHLLTVARPGSQRARPTTMVIGSQHGNEPAGRETALAWLRDLAFTEDPLLLDQLSGQSVLFVPSANPDGRAANSRGNAAGVDVNRDHLSLTQPETRALATVLRDLSPHLALDLHEYGPSVPVLYDDDVLYLWPPGSVHGRAARAARHHLGAAARRRRHRVDGPGRRAGRAAAAGRPRRPLRGDRRAAGLSRAGPGSAAVLTRSARRRAGQGRYWTSCRPRNRVTVASCPPPGRQPRCGPGGVDTRPMPRQPRGPTADPGRSPVGSATSR